MGSPAASAQLGWPWWSHGQMCGTLGTSCSGLPLLLPCAPARLRARFPRYTAKCASSFSQLLCPGTECSSSPSCTLHMQEVGLLWGYCWLYLFSLPVDLFLRNQICSAHQSAPPTAENFHFKQISNSFDFLDQPSLLIPRVAWFDFIYRPSCKDKTLTHGYHLVKMHSDRAVHHICLFPCSFHFFCHRQKFSFGELLNFLPININF